MVDQRKKINSVLVKLRPSSHVWSKDDQVTYSVLHLFPAIVFPLFLLRCCCYSVTVLCLTLCDPMDCSAPGFPVLHYLPEIAQTHIHWVGDVIQPSHPLSSPSPPALNLSQHQGHFQWVNSLHQVAKVLEFQLQHQSFQWFPLGWTDWISLQSKGLSRVFWNTTVQKYHSSGFSFL